MVTVRTPVAGSDDVVGSVVFRGGVAQVDEVTQAAELHYFRAAGYIVEEPKAVEPAVVEVPDSLPRGNASVDVWRTYAAEHGVPDADTMTRDEIVAHFKKETGQ